MMAEQSKQTILIIDDTAENLRLLLGALSSRGYRVRAFPSGPLALRAMAKDVPDLILLDINMPGMSGYEVCDVLKADARLAEVPVIFISAMQDIEAKVSGFERGGQDYITKPFRLEEVFARVETHLEIHRLRRSLEDQNQQLVANQASLNDANTRLEATNRHALETNQVLLEQMVAMSALNRLAQAFAVTSTEQGILDATAAHIRRVADARTATIHLSESGGYGFHRYHLDEKEGAVSQGRQQFAPESLIYEVFRTGRPLWCNDISAAEDGRWTELAKVDHRSAMICPISASDAPQGVLALFSQTRGLFGSRVVPIIERLGSMIGTNLVLRQAVSVLRDSLQTADNLLVNMFPEPVAGRMKSGEENIADNIDCAGVFFCDLAGFTAYASEATADKTVSFLRHFFTAIEAECESHHVEKIKTIGDAFMAVSGVSKTVADPIERIATFALAVAKRIDALVVEQDVPLSFRIGIHAGPLIAGVIGQSRASFDVWGDTVNVASRLESIAPHGAIACSEAVFEALKTRFSFDQKGSVEMKGKGRQPVWILCPEANAP